MTSVVRGAIFAALPANTLKSLRALWWLKSSLLTSWHTRRCVRIRVVLLSMDHKIPIRYALLRFPCLIQALGSLHPRYKPPPQRRRCMWPLMGKFLTPNTPRPRRIGKAPEGYSVLPYSQAYHANTRRKSSAVESSGNPESLSTIGPKQ